MSAAPLLDARNHGGGAALGGSFYAVAGRHQWNELSGDVPDLNQLDPASGTVDPSATTFIGCCF